MKTHLWTASNMLRNRICGLLAVVSIVLGLASCKQELSENSPEQTSRIIDLRLVHPPETGPLLRQALSQFNALQQRTTDGSLVRITQTSFDDLSALDKVGNAEFPASLLLSPSSILIPPSQPTHSFTNCTSIMSTRLGTAYRTIDAFTLPAKQAEATIRYLVGTLQADDKESFKLLIGAPRHTISGNMALMAASSYAYGAPLDRLSPEVVTRALASLQQTQKRVRSYFVSDQDTLSWLTHRDGGQPLIVLTTEQSYKFFQAQTPSRAIDWRGLASDATMLDFPLCSIESEAQPLPMQEAARLALAFFRGDTFRGLLVQAGFNEAASQTEPQSLRAHDTALATLAQWPQIRRPSMTIFVVDTSINTNRDHIETIRREIRAFVDSRPSTQDMVGIIAASSNAEVLSDPSSNSDALNSALNRLTTSGSNAVRDGLQTAFSLLGGIDPLNYRQSIVVFTSSKDQSSQASSERTLNRALQFVGEKDVDLSILAFGTRASDFAELSTLAQDVGASFILTNVALAPQALLPITRRVH